MCSCHTLREPLDTHTRAHAHRSKKVPAVSASSVFAAAAQHTAHTAQHPAAAASSTCRFACTTVYVADRVLYNMCPTSMCTYIHTYAYRSTHDYMTVQIPVCGFG